MKESAKKQYDLVYSRILKLSCLSEADLYGDKSAIEIDLHYAPSGAIIKELFKRFDKDKNGFYIFFFTTEI